MIIWEIKREAQRMILQRPVVYYTFMGASLGKFTLARFLDPRCYIKTFTHDISKLVLFNCFPASGELVCLVPQYP